MLINGEKYACEACVRGHRVSSCTHRDRKLLHVNKKGRPVSQCPHCRSLRKSRTQHVKCDCQDKAHSKEDCPHLKNTPEALPVDQPPQPQQAQQNVCCCGHGARCSCSIKKEHHLDPVPEDITQIAAATHEQPKPRISSLNSHDSKPTVFANGHHKPVHRLNDAHNHCGAPYRVPSRSHTVHGHREVAQRSAENLPLTNRSSPHHESPLHNVTIAAQQPRQVRSEHNSPVLAPSMPVGNSLFDAAVPPLSPTAYSYSPFDPQSSGMLPGIHLPETIPDSWFTTYDEAQNFNPGRVPDFNNIDWSSYFAADPNSSSGNNPYGLAPNGVTSGQIASYPATVDPLYQVLQSGFNTSSGEISEAEDGAAQYRPSNLRTISNASNEISSIDDASESHRLSSASSYMGTPTGNTLASTMEELDIDKYIKEQKARNKQAQQVHTPESHTPYNSQQLPQQTSPPHQLPTPASSLGGTFVDNTFSGENFAGDHPLTVRELQQYAHMAKNPVQQSQEQAAGMQQTGLEVDPMWCAPNPDYGTGFKLDDDKEDEQWVR